MSKIKVPKEMLASVYTDKVPCPVRHQEMERYLESALCWLSENPILPTEANLQLMRKNRNKGVERRTHYMREWQRRMFLAPEPEFAKDGTVVWENDGTPDVRPIGVWFKGKIVKTTYGRV